MQLEVKRSRRPAHRLSPTHHEIALRGGKLEPSRCRSWRIITPWVAAITGVAYSFLFWKGIVPQHFEALEWLDSYYFADTTLGRFCTFKTTLVISVGFVFVVSMHLERAHLLREHGTLIRRVNHMKQLAREGAELKGSDSKSATAEEDGLYVTVTTSPRRIDFDVIHESWGSMRFSVVEKAFEYLQIDPDLLERIDDDLCRRVQKLVETLGR